jgi:hypothetical protein
MTIGPSSLVEKLYILYLFVAPVSSILLYINQESTAVDLLFFIPLFSAILLLQFSPSPSALRPPHGGNVAITFDGLMRAISVFMLLASFVNLLAYSSLSNWLESIKYLLPYVNIFLVFSIPSLTLERLVLSLAKSFSKYSRLLAAWFLVCVLVYFLFFKSSGMAIAEGFSLPAVSLAVYPFWQYKHYLVSFLLLLSVVLTNKRTSILAFASFFLIHSAISLFVKIRSGKFSLIVLLPILLAVAGGYFLFRATVLRYGFLDYSDPSGLGAGFTQLDYLTSGRTCEYASLLSHVSSQGLLAVVFGSGLVTFDIICPGSIYFHTYVHSVPLMMFQQVGILGLVAWLGMFAAVLFRLCRFIISSLSLGVKFSSLDASRLACLLSLSTAFIVMLTSMSGFSFRYEIVGLLFVRYAFVFRPRFVSS